MKGKNMNKHRETRPSDWKIIDEFFNQALQAYKNGEMTETQYRYWITHYIGLANNKGIDFVLEAMKNALEAVKISGWQAP